MEEDIFVRIRAWANDRNLIEGSTPKKQMKKMNEELDELKEALVLDNWEEIIDGFGDCVVVLTIMAAQMNIRLEDAIEKAYDVIRDRKGRMIDGMFVKEEDLPENKEKKIGNG